MKHRHLGLDGPVISAIGLGCMGMSGSYGPSDDDEAVATIRRAVDLGVTLFDTADIYGNGSNESLVGRALKDCRRDVFIASKFGCRPGVPGGGPLITAKPDYVRGACEASLRRLGVDVIDLYYLHRVDPETPIEETVGAMSDLVKAGKVLHIGLCEAGVEAIRRAHSVHPVSALQSEYSLWTRDLEDGILPVLRELGIALVPFSPLGRGYLTGKVASLAALSEGDRRRDQPRFSEENMKRNDRLLASLRAIAEARGATSAQVALAWLLAQGDDIVPIPGTKQKPYLEENVRALGVLLSAEECALLDRVFRSGAVAGARYASQMMKYVNG